MYSSIPGRWLRFSPQPTPDHVTCTEQLRQLKAPLYTCWPVITEAAYLLRCDHIVVDKLLNAFEIGLLALLPLDGQSMPWIAQFLARYRDLNPQLADACLMYLAAREQIDTVFTIDRRDFPAFRLANGRSLNLLPESL